MQLHGTGIWSAQLRYGDAGVIADAAAELDELGYSAIWIPDVGGDVLGVGRDAAGRGAAHRRRDRDPQHLDARTGRGRGNAARRGATSGSAGSCSVSA